MASEKKIEIPLKDGKSIYGLLRGTFAQPLVVYIHGLNGWIYEAMPQDAARVFEKAGYATLRVELYSGKKNARNASETTLKIHASDIADVIAYCKKQGAEQIHLIGHSYGGLTILLLGHQPVNSAVLWDPTHLSVTNFREKGVYLPETKEFILRYGVNFVIGEEMVDESEILDKELPNFLKNYDIPTLIISAGNTDMINGHKEYVKELTPHCEIKQIIVTTATHNFVEEDAKEILLKESLNWIKVHSG